MKTGRIDLFPHRESYLEYYTIEQQPVSHGGRVWARTFRPAVVIMPGGGYAYISPREAEPIALEFLTRGYQAFVLSYSHAENSIWPNPWVDATVALQWIRSHAEELWVDPTQICCAGFSAGGHLASWLGSSFNDPVLLQARNEQVERYPNPEIQGLEDYSNRPDALILGYALTQISGLRDLLHHLLRSQNIDPETQMDLAMQEIKNELGYAPGEIIFSQDTRLDVPDLVNQDTSPTFVWTTAADQIVDPGQSLAYVRSCLKAKVPVEFHMYNNGAHGLSLNNEVTGYDLLPDFPVNVSGWMDLAITWLRSLEGQKY